MKRAFVWVALLVGVMTCVSGCASRTTIVEEGTVVSERMIVE